MPICLITAYPQYGKAQLATRTAERAPRPTSEEPSKTRYEYLEDEVFTSICEANGVTVDCLSRSGPASESLKQARRDCVRTAYKLGFDAFDIAVCSGMGFNTISSYNQESTE